MSTDELIKQLLRNAKPIYIKPTDVLLIGNVGRIPDDAWQHLAEVNQQLRERTGAAHVLLFEAEIDVRAFRTGQGDEPGDLDAEEDQDPSCRTVATVHFDQEKTP